MRSLRSIAIPELSLMIVLLITGCQPSREKEKQEGEKVYEKGTFGYDVAFLNRYYDDLILLENEEKRAMVAVIPGLQGRIMTTTATGMSGKSFGWINYDLIASGETKEHFNPVGGEERFWLGPEGGQFSLYFKPGVPFNFENWYVPKSIDTEPFNVVTTGNQHAQFSKSMDLVNYSETRLKMQVDREVKLINGDSIALMLKTEIPDDVSFVGVESQNRLTNKGEKTWNKDSGMPSIWILSMLNPSQETVIVIPFRSGPIEELGPMVNDIYFGKIPENRLVIKDSVVFFKADGQQRGKIGIPPKRALPIAGSFDFQNHVLTIVQFSIPIGATDYVNSLWEIQDLPFGGDAVNAYNDGPLDDGSIMGPFYEIESSSPAANLSPGESITHVHRIFHFMGDADKLNKISLKLLGADLGDVKGVFK